MNSVVRAGVRLWTATRTPRRAMLRARFAPITARPVTPIWLGTRRIISSARRRPRVGLQTTDWSVILRRAESQSLSKGAAAMPSGPFAHVCLLVHDLDKAIEDWT